MRATLTLDDDLTAALQQEAERKGASFEAAGNEALRAGLALRLAPPATRRYQVRAVSLGGVLPGVDLDKALQLADGLPVPGPELRQ